MNENGAQLENVHLGDRNVPLTQGLCQWCVWKGGRQTNKMCCSRSEKYPQTTPRLFLSGALPFPWGYPFQEPELGAA